MQMERALQCYRAAAYLDDDEYVGPSYNYGSGTSGFVRVAARAGEIGLRLGLRALKDRALSASIRDNDSDLDTMACDVIEECKAYPGVLTAVGWLLEAIVSKEIVKAKCVIEGPVSYRRRASFDSAYVPARQRLKASLDISSRAQDNHLRAVVLALTSAHYYDTASDHAKVMLQTARQLAAGMGAPETQSNKNTGAPTTENHYGNSFLGLWVGESFLGTSPFFGSYGRAAHSISSGLV